MESIKPALGFEIRWPDLNKCLSDSSVSSWLCYGLNAVTLHTSFSVYATLSNKLSSLFSSCSTNKQSSIPSISLELQITTLIFMKNINVRNKI